jgi:hypothetical protein
MKAQYVGDIGDFGKVLLLNHLARCGFKIAVNWMMTHDDQGTDGALRDYINYRGANCLCCCDKDLLRKFVPLAKKARKERSIVDLEAVVEQCAPGTLFFKHYFDEPGMRTARQKEALEQIRRASQELVFLDPDNGFSAGEPTSSKHVYLSELSEYWSRGMSLLVYHHLPQRQFAEQAIGHWIKQMKGFVEGPVRLYRFRRGTGRVYFLCLQQNHRSLLQNEPAKPTFAPLLVTKREWARKQRCEGDICRETHDWLI